VRILVIGGTQFVGRALVDEAARRGHEVTIFHRGNTEPDDLPVVEHIHGDRHADLDRLGRRSWDALVDTVAYVPGEVRAVDEALAGAVRHMTLVSTNAVHPPDLPEPVHEDSPLLPPLFDDAAGLSIDTYGRLKVACEQEASRAFGARCLIIRPGFLIGPHDPTDRFTWYLRRVGSGGEMLAPGPPDAPFQVLDVRDLASFTIDRIEASDTGAYGVVGPDEETTMQGALEAGRDVAGADTTLTWLPTAFLFERIGDERSRWFPMWLPQYPGIHRYDASKALGAGLQRRPLSETIADTLAWDDQRGKPALRVGLPPETESELLAAWREKRGDGD
jgi:nucleoside-diphosphate-sugar epimerase